jgi:hypothetical protein
MKKLNVDVSSTYPKAQDTSSNLSSKFDEQGVYYHGGASRRGVV